MKENYCCLALAILAPRYIPPERAFEFLDKGEIDFRRGRQFSSGLTARDTQDMAVLRRQGMYWRDIADVYEIDVHNVFARVKRWNKAEANNAKQDHKGEHML